MSIFCISMLSMLFELTHRNWLCILNLARIDYTGCHIEILYTYMRIIYIRYIYIDICQIYHYNPDVDGLRPIIYFVCYKFTACALRRHQKPFTCNSRPRFQLLGDPLATSRASVEVFIDDFVDFLHKNSVYRI